MSTKDHPSTSIEPAGSSPKNPLPPLPDIKNISHVIIEKGIKPPARPLNK